MSDDLTYPTLSSGGRMYLNVDAPEGVDVTVPPGWAQDEQGRIYKDVPG